MSARPLKPRVRTTLQMCGLAAALVLTGCTHSEITHTVDGVDVTAADSPVGAAAQIDPCTAISAPTLELLGLSGLEPVTLPPGRTPGCKWAGVNNYTTPSLILWVTGPSEPDPDDEIVDVAGVPVRIYTLLGNVGRYIAHLDEVTLAVNYDGANHLIGGREALEATMTDVLETYQQP